MSILKRNRSGGRTEGTGDQCEYGGTCREPAAGELRAHNLSERGGIPWAMCDEHVRPEHHPRDLHDRLFRWPS